MSETPLQAAARWRHFWACAMDSYGHMCADALSEDDLKQARKYAARYRSCVNRFWEAWTREAVAEKQAPAQASAIRWFGELEEA